MKERVRLNPQMLALAREYRGMTQEELARAAKISQSLVAQIEGGAPNTANEETIEALQEALNFPLSFLTQDGVRLSFGSSSVYYRKKADLTAADRKRIQSQVNINRLSLKTMLDAIEVDTTLRLPKCALEDYGSPAKVASVVRATWQLPDGPVDDLTSLMERAGIVIIECDFGTRSIDGTSFWLAEMPPIVFVNSALPPDRYRFTLAHELGHLVMHDVPHETMEDEADEFASELLMQELEFRVSTSPFGAKPTLRQLAQIKPYWKVAISAMIERLHQLSVISPSTRRSLYIMMSKYKMRMNEPQPFAKEIPKLFRKIFQAAVRESALDVEQARNYLRLPLDVFRHLFSAFWVEPSATPRLRVV